MPSLVMLQVLTHDLLSVLLIISSGVTSTHSWFFCLCFRSLVSDVMTDNSRFNLCVSDRW